MNVFELTRALVDIDSTTRHELRVGEFLHAHLSALARQTGGAVGRMPVAPDRFNILASWGSPVITFSTHMDTVPPFFPSNEDAGFLHGRGSCDAKGIIAAMIAAAEKLLSEKISNFALLFVVGEEKDSLGASVAASHPIGSRFLINGEPTENRLAIGSKGALRYEVIARGKSAHSAYPELGQSAIDVLLDVLADIRRLPLPADSLLGPCTLNIGTISGGRAPNVISDHAQAELMFRLVGDAGSVRSLVDRANASRAELREVHHTPALRLESFDGLPATVVSFTTDIPQFAGAWGQPFLIGPGSIHVAHTAEERIPKSELLEAVNIYASMARRLLASV